MGINAVTTTYGPNKKITQPTGDATNMTYPYVQPNQPLTLTKDAAYGTQAPAPAPTPAPTGGLDTSGVTTDITQQVLTEAQKKALQGVGGAGTTAGMVQQRAQQLLQDPNLGIDYQAQKEKQLAQFDRQRAQAMDALQSQLGGQANLGYSVGQLAEQALAGTQAKADLEAGWGKVIVVFKDRETCENAVPDFEKELGATAGINITLVEFWHLAQFNIETIYSHQYLLFNHKEYIPVKDM